MLPSGGKREEKGEMEKIFRCFMSDLLPLS